MRKTKTISCGILAVVVAVGTLLPVRLMAAEPAWHLTALEGTVRLQQPGADPAAGVVGEVVATGATVTTGGTSRAIIENGLQKIEMSANSQMTIAPSSEAGMTRILQNLGSLLFQVDRREMKHFEVQTPLLAAVVKGTVFSITASPDADVIQVVEGLVDVRTESGSAHRDVAAGQAARVTHDAPDKLAFNAPDTAPGVIDHASLPDLDYATLSDGIVAGPPQGVGAGSAAGSGAANGEGASAAAGTGSANGSTASANASAGFGGSGISANANAGLGAAGGAGVSSSAAASAGGGAASASVGAGAGGAGAGASAAAGGGGVGVGVTVPGGGVGAGVGGGGPPAGVGVP